MDLKKYIYNIKDFPKKGINFQDITPLLNNSTAFKYTIDEFSKMVKKYDVDVIVSPEARGFILGCPVAYNLKKRFVPARKPNKSPREVYESKYKLEYGFDILQIHKDDINAGDNIFIIDDALATGGTVLAVIDLIENSFKANVVGCGFIMQIPGLSGVKKIKKYNCNFLLK